MSLQIHASPPVLSRTNTSDLSTSAPARQDKSKISVDQATIASQETKSSVHHYRKALDRLARPHHGERHHHHHHEVKDLAHSLEKAFDSPKVDRETGEEELRQGGMRRVGKDLRKLFRGLGVPPQQAKQLARGLTEAIRDQDVEHIDLSLTATRAVSLEVSQVQSGYLASGDGTQSAAANAESFQLSAVQVRSLDISLNLTSGEFSVTRTRFDAVSLSSSQAAAVVVGTPAEEQLPAPTSNEAVSAAPAAGGVEPAAEPGTPPAEATFAETSTAETAANDPPAEIVDTTSPDQTFSLVAGNHQQFLQISSLVQQSAVIKLSNTQDSVLTEIADEPEESALEQLQSLVDRLADLASAARDLFEPQVQVNNLRVEEEQGEQHLRFTLDALSPVGLTAVDQEGRDATVYPRPDGSLATVTEEPVLVTA